MPEPRHEMHQLREQMNSVNQQWTSAIIDIREMVARLSASGDALVRLVESTQKRLDKLADDHYKDMGEIYKLREKDLKEIFAKMQVYELRTAKIAYLLIGAGAAGGVASKILQVLPQIVAAAGG